MKQFSIQIGADMKVTRHLIAAIKSLLNTRAEENEDEDARQIRVLETHGYETQQQFFKDFRKAILEDQPIAKDISEDSIVGLINMFGMALVRNFHTVEDKKALFNRISPAKKRWIDDIGRFDAPYTDELDEWGVPIDEVTMAANVSSPQLVTPLGMVRGGRSEPVVMKKKKKKS